MGTVVNKKKKSAARREPCGAVSLFKMVILQRLFIYILTSEQGEFQVTISEGKTGSCRGFGAMLEYVFVRPRNYISGPKFQFMGCHVSARELA